MNRKNKLILVGLMAAGVLFGSTIPITISSGEDPFDFLEKGDIMMMDLQPGVAEKKHYCPGYSNDHCAMYLGDDYGDGEQFIEVDHNGTHNRSWDGGDGFSDWYENFTYYEVEDATWSEECGAVNFSLSCWDDEYQYFPSVRKYNDPADSDEWYCSELVWASWYNCNGVGNVGIDIDYNGWNTSWPLMVPAVALGFPYWEIEDDISRDGDIEQIFG